MGNIYEVHLNDGRTVLVETDDHHSNHDSTSWFQHIVILLREIAVNVASGHILRTVHKGRR